MDRINLLLMADDRLTPALILANKALQDVKGNVRKTDEALRGLQGAAGRMDGLHQGLKGLASGLMAVGTGAALGAIAAATAGIWGLTNAVKAAGKEQTRTLMTVSDIAGGLGLGFDAAQKQVESLKESIADMAAPLPGDTTVYTDLFNAVGGGLSRTFRGRADEFKEATEDIVKRAGVLASVQGVGGADAGSVFDRLIQGNGGFRELALNDVIQRNATFKFAMEDQMKQLGIEVDDWQKQTTETRLRIVRAALKIATPDELINRFNNTFESVTQGIQTYWFNPLKGVFGVMRKVTTDKGITTGLEAVTEVLRGLVDLGGAVTTWAKVRGINFDPMLALVNFLGGVNQVLTGIEYFIRSGGQLPKFNFDFDPISYIRGLGTSLPKMLNSAFSNINTFLSNVDLAEIGTASGELINSVSSMLAGLFNNTDWIAVGETLGRLLGSAIRGAVNFLAKLDYPMLGNMIGSFVLGVAKLAIGILKGVVLDFGSGIGKYLGDIWDGIAGQWGRLVSGVQALIDRILGWVDRITAPITRPVEALTGANISPTAAVANPLGTILDIGKGALEKGAELGKNLMGTPDDKPLSPPSTSNSKKVAYNSYSPSVSINAPNAEALGATTVETLASQYKTFISQMA